MDPVRYNKENDINYDECTQFNSETMYNYIIRVQVSAEVVEIFLFSIER